MALKQERMLALIQVADQHQKTIDLIRDSSESLLTDALSLTDPDSEVFIQIKNALDQIKLLTQPNRSFIQIIETEKAYYNPSRIKHNEYMRSVKHKYNARQRIKDGTTDKEPTNILDLDASDLSPNDEIPLFKNLETEEAKLKIEESNTESNPENLEELKAKFGETYSPPPIITGFGKNK